MRKLIALLLLVCLSVACSNDDSISVQSAAPTPSVYYVNMKVNGTEISDISVPPALGFNSSDIKISGNVLTLTVNYGVGGWSHGINRVNMMFTKTGKLIKADLDAYSVPFQLGTKYYNFIHFPTHYFDLDIISIDENTKTVKGTFSGKLYLNKLNLDSESVDFDGDFNLVYDGNESSYSGILYNGVVQHCSAKINGNQWNALTEHYQGIFTAEDPYRIEIHFGATATTGTYNVTPNMPENYIRFSKFNTITRAYDYYDVTGILNHTYREAHGGNRYSFFGNFTFTAVNPNNQSDIIQVTDGDFRSYQQL